MDVETGLGDLLCDLAVPGQAALAQSARHLVADRTGVDLSSSEADLLDPLIVSWLTHPAPSGSLSAMVLGSLGPAGLVEAGTAVADETGVIELPGLGWLRAEPREIVRVEWVDHRRVRVRRAGERRGAVVELAPLDVAATSAVIAASPHPLHDRLFVDPAGERVAVEPLSRIESLRRGVHGGFALLARAVPELHGHLAGVVRRVTLHRAGRVHSFAAPQAHGAVFLATRPDDIDVGIAEDLAHQGGHVLCSAMSVDRSVFFSRDPNTPVASISGHDDTRSLYETFHGVFTEAAMILALSRIVDLDDLGARRRHEAIGRLALISSRAGRDLRSLASPGLFTERGASVLELCRAALEDAVARRHDELVRLDLAGQPYAFSYAAFASRNPVLCSASTS